MKKFVYKLSKVLLTAIIIVSASTILAAQNNTNSNRYSATSTVLSDTDFIRKNITDNTLELQLAQLGRQKSTDPQIKTMAQQMVMDQTRILNDLRRVARQKKMMVTSPGIDTAATGNA